MTPTRVENADTLGAAEALNRDCYCIAVNRAALQSSLAAHLAGAGLPEALFDASSRLFADSPVFLGGQHLVEMARLIQAVERVTHNPAYRDRMLATAPVSCREDFGPSGVFFGYDFHLGAEGPRLIEINTNAGGALLNLYLASAQQSCCDAVINFFGGKRDFADAERELIAMFRAEWSSQVKDRALRTIAIVDDAPASQFLYPEFLLFQSLFERNGIEAVIVDPEDLAVRGSALYSGERRIDLVYNRLTDFYLAETRHATLRRAYEEGLVVLTPSPLHYALYADKRNLPLLSDPDWLKELGVADDDIETLWRLLPAAVAVTKDNAAQLWTDRRQFVFKPVTGHGSRGVYRGAKMTTRVWDEIVQADYIAQAMVPPSERQLIIDGARQALKLDIRCVSYRGSIQQVSARLNRGQTTNLRTEGGGLATVFSTPTGTCPCD